MSSETKRVPVDQFKPVDKKLLKWAQNLADNPHEFTYVLYNQARRIEQLEAERKAILELPDKWRKYSFDNPEAAEYIDSADCADELEALLPKE